MELGEVRELGLGEVRELVLLVWVDEGQENRIGGHGSFNTSRPDLVYASVRQEQFVVTIKLGAAAAAAAAAYHSTSRPLHTLLAAVD
ncbi:hypothetical protein Pcinc_011815 [Petrolisthes cinctipes]|uniref:Uncharacterized protein n=1 Tax=Petrolisthes cinctipes TaxID=88211 RepID=A0AAE1KS40_PETCI|nr:hypothetical protein Pcinc_011815 [Petrolisthes cinctipes]